jgi:hypothetical protein
MDSPVLQQAGVTPTFESPEKSVTSKVYSQARIANVGKSELYKRQWGDGERVVEVLGKSMGTAVQAAVIERADHDSWRRSALVRLKEAVPGTVCTYRQTVRVYIYLYRIVNGSGTIVLMHLVTLQPTQHTESTLSRGLPKV